MALRLEVVASRLGRVLPLKTGRIASLQEFQALPRKGLDSVLSSGSCYTFVWSG